jgi:hypothetical protein
MNLITRNKKHILQLLESSPHALAYLVFWWLNTEIAGGMANEDDGKFYRAMGYNDTDYDLPSPSVMCPTWNPPITLRKAYRPERVKPLLQFAWDHGFITEVATCQSALRAAGLERYCIGSAPETSPSDGSSVSTPSSSPT